MGRRGGGLGWRMVAGVRDGLYARRRPGPGEHR